MYYSVPNVKPNIKHEDYCSLLLSSYYLKKILIKGEFVFDMFFDVCDHLHIKKANK